MTGTTKAAPKKVAVSSAVIAAVLQDLAAIDLSNATLPEEAKEKRCKHYRELGVADDDLKRVILLRINTVRALRAAREADQAKTLARLEEEQARVNGLKPDDYNVVEELKGIGRLVQDIKKPSAETADLNTRLGILNALMRAEGERQFPELRTSDFSVGPDFMIGFADHSNLADELGDSIFGGLPDGISIEVIGMSGPDDRDPFEGLFGGRRSSDLFGSIFGRGGRRGFDILDLFRRH